MANAYYYSSTAGTYTLNVDMTTTSTVVNLNGITGLPGSTPFKMVIDPGQASEEIVKVTATAGSSLTVVRAWDGSTASSHSAGALVRHMMTAEDFTLSRTHEAATTSVHGVTGSVVGTGNTQSLVNKDLTSPSNTFPGTLVTLTGTQALSNKDFSSSTNVFPSTLATDTELSTAVANHAALTATHGATGAIVGTTNAQTLTNKTMDGGSNTFTNIPQGAVTGLTAVQSDVNALKADSGWITLPVTPFAGWTCGLMQGRKVGHVVVLEFTFTRTGAQINGTSDGNITNVAMGTLTNSAYVPFGNTIGITNGWGGPLWNGYVDSSGIVAVGALAPGQPISTNDVFFGTAMFLN